MSLYEYISSNPAGLTDPTGLCPGAGTTAPTLNLSYGDAQGAGGTDYRPTFDTTDLFLRPSDALAVGARALPDLHPGMENATPQVKARTKEFVESGAAGYTQVVETPNGTFHVAVSVFELARMGERGASMIMDFCPNEALKTCCTKIGIVQQMQYLQAGTPVYSADWHTDEKGNRVDSGMAQRWATADGSYIERAHTANTPYMAGVKDESGMPEGRLGTGTTPLVWEDVPQGPIGVQRVRGGTEESKQELVAVVVCLEGSDGWQGKVLGSVRYGWRFKPSGERGVAPTFEPIKPVFSPDLPQDVQKSIGAWNEKTPAAWPRIQVQGKP